MKAALLFPSTNKLEIDDVSIDSPQSHEVLIRTMSAGLCHSDLHFLDSPALAEGVLRGGCAILGHEASGVVEEVGDAVTYVKVGDHVITYPSQFCGECDYCLQGRLTLCLQSPGARTGTLPRLTLRGKAVNQFANLSGFAEMMLVHEKAVVKINPEYPLDRAALIGCGIATGLGAVFNTAGLRPGTTVAVVGCGGVGLAAIQGAAIAGARQIVAVDTQPHKFELAKHLGATDTVDASQGDPVAAVKDLTQGGVDYAFEAIGLKSTCEQSYEMARSGGIVTIIGLILEKFELDGAKIGEKRVQGCRMGSNRSRIDLPHYIELDERGRIDVESLIEQRISLDQINDGFEAMRQGDINGRRVIVFPE